MFEIQKPSLQNIIGVDKKHPVFTVWCYPESRGGMGNERLTGALLDRLTHCVHVLEANGESCRLKEAKRRRKTSTKRFAN